MSGPQPAAPVPASTKWNYTDASSFGHYIPKACRIQHSEETLVCNECSAGVAANDIADKGDDRPTADKISRVGIDSKESCILVINVHFQISGVARA